jgi:hypothetical protein
MSELALETFVAYKAASTESGFEFFPSPRQVKKKAGKTVVTLADIPLPGNAPAPQGALTVLYGFRDAIEQMQQHHKTARDRGMSLVKVSFKLDVADITMSTTSLDSLAATRFLNLRRLSIDLQQRVLDAVNEMSANEGKRAVFFEKMADAGARPDLVCKAVRAEKLFQHIVAVAYTVPDGTPKGRQVATIFTSKVGSITLRGMPDPEPFSIELPVLR